MAEMLTESSSAVRLLRKKIAAGEIAKDANPKKVHQSETLFRCHKLDKFRTKFRKLKAEYADGE